MIDFVIPWVDGSDPVWQASFRAHLPESKRTDDIRAVRYRDWDNLRYWFRGVEKFTPWVNRIHFVTCGQIPEWLNMDAPKLHFVKHEDYIPKHYLPTFSANPIEINMHRIEGLSEQFVYFNDDFFLIDEVKPDRFFKKGLPCDMAVLNSLRPGYITHIVLNDLEIINSVFSKREVLCKHFWRWFTPKMGDKLLRTLALLPWPSFTGIYNHHFPQGFLRSTLIEVWNKHGEMLAITSASKFRSISDVNQWLFRYWQLAKGDFFPLNVYKDSSYFEICDHSLEKIVETIKKQKKKIIVLNDGEVSSFEAAKKRINAAFYELLPEKSSFEK
ncbi:Stealth CR1 domain-containing protein [Parabacteroides gordonii]|jgi:hypothetical protein|uniref:Stealth CR1 domain-containing protein n=1 Tax=Parabacteroides gordonii TaxID=574930 RepID=UPI00241D723D|nr:Stealth CR1 domain-containing protein [Parabacteroides gordonii]